MYGWLWRKLPGGWAVKSLQSLALLFVTCAVLVLFVFPWVEPKLPFSGNTVDGGGGTTSVIPTPNRTSTPTSTPTHRSTGTGTPKSSTSTTPSAPGHVLPGE